MNYIAHLKAFSVKRKQTPLTANELALYYTLCEFDNELGWMEWFTIPNTTLQGLSGLSLPALHRARGELARKGYIKYRQGAGNQAGRYLIVDFETQSNIQSDTQMIHKLTHNPTRNPTTLNKLNQTKLIEDTNVSSCAELSDFSMPLNDGTEHFIKKSELDEWKRLYPAVDVEQQLRNMRGWLMGNPKNRKTKAGINRFITSWLGKEQNRTRTASDTGKGAYKGW